MRNLWRQLRDAAGAIVSFWLLTAFGLVALCGAVMWFYHTAEDYVTLATIVATTILGTIVGQLMGFFRLRPWVVWIVALVSIALGITLVTYVPLTPATEFLALFFFFFPFAFNSGIWTMRPRMHLFAVWYPMMLAIGAIITIAENSGATAAWFAGRKWAIWSIPSFVILSGMILLLLGFLVAQQSYSLARWRSEGSAPDRRETRVSGAPRVRLSLAGWAVILLLSGALTVITAGVAPYLWRTAPDEDGHPTDGGGGDGSTDGGGVDGGGDHDGDRDGSGGRGGDRDGSGGGGGGGGDQDGGGGSADGGDGGGGGGSGGPSFDSEDMKQRGKSALSMVLYFLMLLLFMLLLAAVGGALYRPLSRAIIVHHWTDPLWSVPPSHQIENLWRRTRLALQDAGFEVRQWEPAAAVAQRARVELGARLARSQGDLSNAVEIHRRAAYGLGVGDEDVARMRAATAVVVDSVGRRTELWEQIKNLFRGV